jgi:hypothetical protein
LRQEAKAEAVAAGAAAAVVALLLGVSGSEGPTNGCGGGSSAQAGGGSGGSDGAGSDLQQQLCCNALEALCHLRQGRAAVVEKAGLHALTAALGSVPDAASAALKVRRMYVLRVGTQGKLDSAGRAHGKLPGRVTLIPNRSHGIQLHPLFAWACALRACRRLRRRPTASRTCSSPRRA